jgi:hypothetical protein
MGDNGKNGAPFLNKNAETHGLHPLRRTVMARGLSALDKRSATYRDLMERREQIINELGGPSAITKQQEIAVDALTRECLFLDQVDSWVLAQDSIITGRGKKKELLPIFRHRDGIVRRMTSLLSLVGLERRALPLRSAIDIIRADNGDRSGNGG